MSDVGLGHYETRAANLLQRLGQLAEHLRQVQANPQLVPPDWYVYVYVYVYICMCVDGCMLCTCSGPLGRPTSMGCVRVAGRPVQSITSPTHDRPAIVTHFRVTEHQLEQLGRDVQPFLQYFVLRPQARPPPQADGA